MLNNFENNLCKKIHFIFIAIRGLIFLFKFIKFCWKQNYCVLQIRIQVCNCLNFNKNKHTAATDKLYCVATSQKWQMLVCDGMIKQCIVHISLHQRRIGWRVQTDFRAAIAVNAINLDPWRFQNENSITIHPFASL